MKSCQSKSFFALAEGVLLYVVSVVAGVVTPSIVSSTLFTNGRIVLFLLTFTLLIFPSAEVTTLPSNAIEEA